MIALNTIAKTQLEKALARAEAENIKLIHTDISGVYFVRSPAKIYTWWLSPKRMGLLKAIALARPECTTKFVNISAIALKAPQRKAGGHASG
jgi:hypothetical protein